MENKQIQEVPSLISREASTAIKGLLILLVVYGHTAMLTRTYDTGERRISYYWLYSFHVFVFFILPIIYGLKSGVKQMSQRGNLIDSHSIVNELKHNLVRIGVPYCWFFLFSVLVFVTVGGGELSLEGILYAFFFGNEPLIDKYIGFNFMWFLPAMLALLTMKSVWYHSTPIIKKIIIAVAIVLWSLSILKVATINQIGMYIPFALSQGICFIIFGLIARRIIEMCIPNKYLIPVVVVFIAALSVIIYYWRTMKWHCFIDVYSTIRLIMPIFVFLLLYKIRDFLAKSNLLGFVGKYSLQIYLVHVFIINGLTILFSHFMKPNIGLGVVIYALAIVTSASLALAMVRIPTVYKIIFPKG